MKQTQPLKSARKKLTFFHNASKPYKALRSHLDRQPVGFPRTLTGTEIRLLKKFFTIEEARVALCLDFRGQTFSALSAKAKEMGFTDETLLKNLLLSMEKKGSIFVRQNGSGFTYALHPFVIGMFEMHLSKMDASFFLDTHQYMLERLIIEYLSTEVPQMRVVPIHESITAAQNVATYDQIREIVDKAGDRIAITNCICRTGRDMIGDPCKLTKRREVCMGFRDYADTYSRNGWGRLIDKTEALEILDRNEKEGLILLASGSREPLFVCSCCNCCCGILEMVSAMPRPVDFTAGNFYAELDATACNGCGKCVKRCHLNAITYDKKKIFPIDLNRCIGCGVCVPTCKTGALRLKTKEPLFIPPADHDDLYETIMRNKRGLVGQLTRMSKAVMGIKI